jgi:hypothetical protein
LAVIYIVARGVVFTLVSKTQFDERRYLMPELRRYDLLTMEMLEKISHAHEEVEHVLEALPKFMQ